MSSPKKYISAGAANQDAYNMQAPPSGPGQGLYLMGVQAQNTHATLLRFLKVYNGQNPTSASVPVKTYPLAPMGGGLVVSWVSQNAPNFPGGISIRITTGISDNDTGSAGAGEVAVNMDVSY